MKKGVKSVLDTGRHKRKIQSLAEYMQEKLGKDYDSPTVDDDLLSENMAKNEASSRKKVKRQTVNKSKIKLKNQGSHTGNSSKSNKINSSKIKKIDQEVVQDSNKNGSKNTKKENPKISDFSSLTERTHEECITNHSNIAPQEDESNSESYQETFVIPSTIDPRDIIAFFNPVSSKFELTASSR